MPRAFLLAVRAPEISAISLLISLTFASQAQTTGGNPLDKLPQAPTPAPAQPAPTNNLQMSKGFEPNHPLQRRVQVNRVHVSGVKSVAFEEISKHFKDFVGKEVTVQELAQATGQATGTYQQAGFPLSFVYLPEQSFDNGIVHVTAVEGHITQVQITGDAGKSQKIIEEIASPLLDSKPLAMQDFQRVNLLLSRMLNVQVVPQAAMPKTTDGAIPLQLNAQHKPVLFGVGGEMRQGQSKAVASLVLNDPFWGGSQWLINALLENPKKERMVSASWHQLLNAQGTDMRLTFTDFKGKENFDVGIGSVDDITSQRKLQLSITHPLRLTPQGSTILGGSIYGLNYAKQYSFSELGIDLEDHEKVRAIQAFVQWQKINLQSSHTLSATITQGLDALGAEVHRSDLLVSAQGRNPAQLDFSRLGFTYDWRWRSKKMWGAAFGVAGQASNKSLPISERISFGGMSYGRGYRSGEAAGDQGWGFKLEGNRIFRREGSRWLRSMEPYVMYEQSKTWFHETAFPKQTLKSSSLGIRLSDERYYTLDLAASKPQGFRSSVNPQQKVRYSLSLTYRFD